VEYSCDFDFSRGLGPHNVVPCACALAGYITPKQLINEEQCKVVYWYCVSHSRWFLMKWIKADLECLNKVDPQDFGNLSKVAIGTINSETTLKV